MKIILSIKILLFISILLHAQISVHKHISVEDGLISDQVRVIFEDSKGYIWFGTDVGVSRWDGVTFFNLTEKSGLTSAAVFDITEGNDGTIYLATFGYNGITTFLNGKIDTLFGEDDKKLNFVSIINSTKDGSLLLAAQDGIYLFENQTLVNLNNLYNITPTPIYRSRKNGKGEIYFATGSGIFKYYNKSLSVFKGNSEGKIDFISSIGINTNDEIIFSDEKKIWISNGIIIQSIDDIKSEFASETNDILFTKNNIGYFATNSGLLIRENSSKQTLITTENGLANNKLWQVFEDRNGSIYLASSVGGVSIYQHKRMENYTNNNGLVGNSVLNFFIDYGGRQFISTDEGLMIKHGKNTIIIDAETKYRYDKFISIKQKLNGEIILGSHSGIDKYSNSKLTSIISFKQTKDIQHQEKNFITSIAEQNDSTILLASYKGVYKIVNDEINLLNKKDGLLSNYVSSIIAMRDNSIVFGYHGKGISILNNGQFTHFSTENGLSGNTILSLFERSDGALLVGTQQEGLNIIKFGKIDTINTSNGLTSNEIRGINEDEFGSVYLTTPKGLNILNFREKDYHVRTITKEDGLVGNDCNLNSLFIDSENNVWIGTTSGLSKYNPKFDKPNGSPSPVILTGFEIFNNPMPLEKITNNGVLDYDENYIKFIYTSIAPLSSHKTIYQYRLSGVDHDWVTSAENNVQYTSLDDGKYTFEIKSRNEWGHWTKINKTNFVITPAWWETWWFYSLIVLTLASLIAFVASYRYRNLLAVEKVRTKISADLHDSIGSGLTEISFLSEMVKFQVKKNENPDKGLNNITGISKSLIEDMRDIVWLVNPSKDSLKDLFNRLQDSYQEALKYSNIKLVITGIDKLSKVRLPISYRQNIFLAFKEAINNSIKYSECKSIEVSVSTDGGNLKVELKDDGKGFDIDKTKMGNGIQNIKKRAKLANGDLFIISEIGKGTTIEFTGKFKKLRITEI